MSLAAGTRLGSYVIEAPLGAGGMGEVYKARDTKLDRDVAVKVLPDHLASDETARARFEREARAIAALSHPNILAIYDFGIDPSTGSGQVPSTGSGQAPSTGSGQAVAYAVMELLSGETLRARLEAGRLGPRKLAQIGADLAQGLAAAHDKGIVHRDVKPSGAVAGLTVYSLATKVFTKVPGDLARANGWLWPEWLADGRRLLVRRPDGIAIVEATSGQGRMLLPVGGFMVGHSVGLSRDNRWITYTETATEGDIWVATLKK